MSKQNNNDFEPRDTEGIRLTIENRKADALFAIAKALNKVAEELGHISYSIRR